MKSSQSSDGLWATVVSAVMLLIGASTVFAALESALQQIWGGRAALSRNWRAAVRARILSFGFILAVGFLLLVSLTLTTALAALRGYALRHFEGMVSMFGLLDFLTNEFTSLRCDSFPFSLCLLSAFYRFLFRHVQPLSSQPIDSPHPIYLRRRCTRRSESSEKGGRHQDITYVML